MTSTLCHRIIRRTGPRTGLRTQRRSSLLQYRARVRGQGALAYVEQGEHQVLEEIGGVLWVERVRDDRACST